MFWRRKKIFKLDLNRLADIAELSGDDFEEQFAEELNSTADDFAEELTRAVFDNVDAWIKEFRQFRAGFEKRLAKIWKPALALFDFTVLLATEVGADMNTQYRPRAAEEQDYVFEALTRLHGRACLTASEVGSLLKSGHATGANGRWRTLNEIAVVAMFISDTGQDVAHRYLEHQWIEGFWAAKDYHEHAERLGHAQDSSLLDEALDGYQELVSRYGEAFSTPYGWAADALKNRRPTFRDILKATDLEHWIPYYRLANLGVHAGSRGGFFDLGMPPSVEHIPARPSHFGLADPGGNSLLSLMQTTVTMIVYNLGSADEPSMSQLPETIITLGRMKLLVNLAAEGSSLFTEIQMQLEKEGPQSSEVPRVFEDMQFADLDEN